MGNGWFFYENEHRASLRVAVLALLLVGILGSPLALGQHSIMFMSIFVLDCILGFVILTPKLSEYRSALSVEGEIQKTVLFMASIFLFSFLLNQIGD